SSCSDCTRAASAALGAVGMIVTASGAALVPRVSAEDGVAGFAGLSLLSGCGAVPLGTALSGSAGGEGACPSHLGGAEEGEGRRGKEARGRRRGTRRLRDCRHGEDESQAEDGALEHRCSR